MFIKNCYEQSAEANDYLYWYCAHITSFTHSNIFDGVYMLNDEYYHLNKQRVFLNPERSVKREKAERSEENRDLMAFLRNLHD